MGEILHSSFSTKTYTIWFVAYTRIWLIIYSKKLATVKCNVATKMNWKNSFY